MSKSRKTKGTDDQQEKKSEYSGKHLVLRIIAVVVFLFIGIGSITYGIVKLVSGDKGWTTIAAGRILDNYYDGEIFLEYNVKNTATRNRLQALYKSALSRVAPLFDVYDGHEGINNIYYINRHINEQIVVDELLYSAFERINENNFRTVFTAPLFEEYSGVFSADSDSEAEDYDPRKNVYVKERADKIAQYAMDKNSVDLRLLGNNTVMLYVSEEYRKYFEEIGGEAYIDLWLVKNAFIVDYCADVITGNGYTGGRISSRDGYVRNFDSGSEYKYSIVDLSNGKFIMSGNMYYNGAISAITMRSFPIKDEDYTRYFVYSDGQIRTEYLDPQTCLDMSFAPYLTVYSYSKKCADIAFLALDSFISADGKLGQIKAENGIYYIYSSEQKVYYSEKGVSIEGYSFDPIYQE